MRMLKDDMPYSFALIYDIKFAFTKINNISLDLINN